MIRKLRAVKIGYDEAWCNLPDWAQGKVNVFKVGVFDPRRHVHICSFQVNAEVYHCYHDWEYASDDVEFTEDQHETMCDLMYELDRTEQEVDYFSMDDMMSDPFSYVTVDFDVPSNGDRYDAMMNQAVDDIMADQITQWHTPRRRNCYA